MTPLELLTRYRFLRRKGWTQTHARTAIQILSGKFHGIFAK